MIYPTLLFTEEPSKKTIKPDVYKDMKLDLLLSNDVLDIMSAPCSDHDISERQRVFSEIIKDSSVQCALRSSFSELSKIAERMTSLYSDYTSAVCDEEKNILCAILLKEIVRFSHSAACIKSETFMCSRFADAFVKKCSESRFLEIETALSELKPKLNKVRSYICSLSGKAQYLSRSEENSGTAEQTAEGYLSKLLRCAKNFGFSDISVMSLPRRCNAGIFEAASRLYPEQFDEFKLFFEKHNSYIEPEILKYKTELDFYLSVSALAVRIKKEGIPLCFPRIGTAGEIDIRSAYDITLLEKGEKNIIPNSAIFTKNEPLFFLTGANGGGKTTYLRTVGVTLLLFLCGAPTPCEDAEITPLRCVHTHFPRDERFELSGRFLDEQNRVDEILRDAGEDTLVLLNETYSTTGEEKAIRCTLNLASELHEKGVFGIYVTHQDIYGRTEENTAEIPFLNVLLDTDGEKRTYKVARRKNTEGSHAQDVLKKYSIDRASLSERFGI